jgi:hypothetical protein
MHRRRAAPVLACPVQDMDGMPSCCVVITVVQATCPVVHVSFE